eukprot:CAMPEP_0177233374 /NCGR_PEP_ID=MMETSP0367-20130122/43833_1 /TAXON_ID=447022 ORGANISM="Scrippsiella hangoei-like, Strain SHHI-4" /NCGR_SAMPLE_ID=MMETSP0367 /ASSEMBLY_ACC=CAM_ASM_000362 /LENGTH=448 /DNA_ID=CAMNT_0018684105 /DNA_START=1 /DNA_END=1347 /DNA_ORIENTATION=+
MPAQEAAQALLAKLQRGADDEDGAAQFLKMGPSMVPDALVLATIGNRTSKVPACPKVLRALLEHRANPEAVDQMTQGPCIHSACWHGSLDVVKLLLDYRANIEAAEPRMKTPPLNTALAAGNAPVCLELLNRNADVLWTHHDGATALHVACAWIASSHNAQLRMPPVGEEPRAVISMMLHNGVDPTQTEGMTKSASRGTGMTPLETFRRQIAMSPWRNDESIGKKFYKMSEDIHLVLEQGEEAVKLKNQANKAFSQSRYPDALRLYADARKVWKTADIRGHHSAVLFSNEATVHKKMEDFEKCREACKEGLTHYCSEKIRKKLEDSLKEAEDEVVAIAAGHVKEKPLAVARKPPSKLKEGFIEESEKPLYPPEGSAQAPANNPGPFICHFDDAKEAGFVDGIDGWKDRKTREEQELDKDLVRQGLMSPELLDDPKKVQYINPLPPGVG